MADVEKALEKKFGKEVFFAGDQLLEQDITVVPVSPALDLILGGGIPMGSFVVITGKPKIGKSSLCLHFAKNAQKMGYKVYYFSIEGRLKKRDLKGVTGLKTDKESFEIVASQKGHILYAEDFLDILNSYVETKENSIFIIDSISQLCSKARKANTIGDRFRDDVPLLLADMTKRVSNILPVTNNTVICITHLIANQGGMGRSQWNEASGQKVQYQADIKLKALYSEAYSVGEDQVGQIVHWECGTNALNVAPCKKAQSLLRYGEGIDCEYEILAMCISIGLIEQAGAWFKFPNGEKLQGKEKARHYLVANPDVYEELSKKLKDMIG
jgi:recombination protein RecA